MDENVKAHLDSRVNTLAPYLSSVSDPDLVARGQAVLDGMTALAQQSADADAFERALAASPLNTEYGLVYSQLITGGAKPSMGQAMGAVAKGVAEHKGAFAATALETLASDVTRTAKLAAEDAVIDATREDYLRDKQAMREDPVLGNLETASNLLGGLRGLFGRKK